MGFREKYIIINQYLEKNKNLKVSYLSFYMNNFVKKNLKLNSDEKNMINIRL